MLQRDIEEFVRARLSAVAEGSWRANLTHTINARFDVLEQDGRELRAELYSR